MTLTPNSKGSSETTQGRSFGEELMGALNVGPRSLEPWLKSVADITKNIPLASQAGESVGSLMNIIKPSTTTTPAPETIPTTQEPAQQGFGVFSTSFEPDQLLGAPAKMVGALTSFNLTQGLQTGPLKDIASVGVHTSKVFTKLSGIGLTAPPESENAYYEYSPSDEWYGHRKPIYFSKECSFRVACEIGRLAKPVLSPVAQQLTTNKIVQDLQSRYSRAFYYGTLYDSCERYFCVFLQLFGGPQKFVAATAEIVKQIASPEPVGLEETRDQ